MTGRSASMHGRSAWIYRTARPKPRPRPRCWPVVNHRRISRMLAMILARCSPRSSCSGRVAANWRRTCKPGISSPAPPRPTVAESLAEDIKRTQNEAEGTRSGTGSLEGAERLAASLLRALLAGGKYRSGLLKNKHVSALEAAEALRAAIYQFPMDISGCDVTMIDLLEPVQDRGQLRRGRASGCLSWRDLVGDSAHHLAPGLSRDHGEVLAGLCGGAFYQVQVSFSI